MRLAGRTWNDIKRGGYGALLVTLFFLAGLNLFAIRGIFLLMAFSLELLRLFALKRIKISVRFLAVFLFAASLAGMYLFYYGFNLTQLILIGLLPLAAFLIGSGNVEKGDTILFYGVFALAIGYAITVSINVAVTLLKGFPVGPDGFSAYFDVMLQKTTWRTFVSVDLVPLLGFASAFLIIPPKEKRHLIFFGSLVILVGSLILNAFVGNRSFMLVGPGTILLFATYNVLKRPTRKKLIIASATLCLIVALFGFVFLILQTDLWGLKTLLLKIPAISRFSDKTGSGRGYQYWAFGVDWLSYPLGGMSVANLFYGFEIHNTFLQVYSIGGWIPFLFEIALLICLLFDLLKIEWSEKNRRRMAPTIALIFAFLAIGCLEPMITSEPFVCSLFFLCAGHLYGERAKEKGQKPLLAIGLSHGGGASLSARELALKSGVAIILFGCSALFTVLSESGSVFSVIALLLLAVAFALIDRTTYAPIFVVKTVLCLFLSCGFAVALNIYLPTSTWMYAFAKSALSIAVFIFLRIVVVSKNEEKDGYYRLRNFFTKLARDIDGSPEENLVSQDLQTNNEGE